MAPWLQFCPYVDTRRDNVRSLLRAKLAAGYWEGMGLTQYEPIEHEVVRYHEAPLFSRAIAQAIDLAFAQGLFMGFWNLLQFFELETTTFSDLFSALVLLDGKAQLSLWTSYAFLLAGALTFYFYFVLVPFRFGATPGKRLLDLEIVSTNGHLSQTQLLVREAVGKWVLGWLTKGILLALPLIRSDGKGIGDCLAHTDVKRAIRRKIVR